MINYKEEIMRLKQKHDAHILAHYYQAAEVQEVADFVGDSYYLSKVGMESKKNTIVFCGVSFMAESAKILSPHKRVLLPRLEAKCSMVELATKQSLERMKAQHPQAKVVSYVNSSTAVKSISDACCTSSNAVKVIQNIDAEEIIFVPDRNLGEYIQEHVPDKKLILWDGFCCVHQAVRAKQVLNRKERILADLRAKGQREEPLEVLVHPECIKETRDTADFIGSTGQLIQYAGKSDSNHFLVVTEDGILYQLKKAYPHKVFHNLDILCRPMKRISLEDVYLSLEEEQHEILLNETLRRQAYDALMQMHELGK